MYARVTKMYGDPERIDEARERVGEVKDHVSGISGLQYWFTASDDESGEAMAIAIYDSKENADAAASTARDLRASFGDLFTKEPEVAEYSVDESWVR